MTRYFFHLHDNVDCEDEEGVELPDEKAAKAFALVSARDMASVEVKHGRLNVDHYIEIRADDGRHVGDMLFREVVTICTAQGEIGRSLDEEANPRRVAAVPTRLS